MWRPVMKQHLLVSAACLWLLSKTVKIEKDIFLDGKISLEQINEQSKTRVSTADPGLKVFTAVPGGDAAGIRSNHFSCRIRKQGGAWQDAFVFQSESHPRVKSRGRNLMNGYFNSLVGWTSSWVNFEIGDNTVVEVELTSQDGDISAATVHPQSDKVKISVPQSDKVTLTITGEAQFMVDINGALSSQNTAGFARSAAMQGMQVHTFSMFANPMLLDRPDPADTTNVRTVSPGDPIPVDFSQNTLYFLPGVHNISDMPPCCIMPITDQADECDTQGRCDKAVIRGYSLKSGKKYYIPGDAWLDGYIEAKGPERQLFTKLFGYGAISGRRYQRRGFSVNKAPGCVQMLGCIGCQVSGVTCVDGPNHHFMLNGERRGTNPDPAVNFNVVHHVKVMGWRSNGDGVHCFKYWNAHDIFLRTQDDSIYVLGGSKPKRGVYPGQRFQRITTWNDANGVPFILGAGGKLSELTILEDSTAIFFRKELTAWCKESGVFTNRHSAAGSFYAKNIDVTDPFPTCPLFRLYGTHTNHTYKDVTMMAHATSQLPEHIENADGMTLKNVNIAGTDANALKSTSAFEAENVRW